MYTGDVFSIRKMKLSTLDFTSSILIAVLCLLGFINFCSSAPLDQYFPTDDTESNNPQRLQLLKELREMIDIEEKSKEAKQLQIEGDDTGLYRVVPQKRFRPFRTQTRAGGVALCLWKVCPAAPWLVSKRR